jgi:hypothetical protein
MLDGMAAVAQESAAPELMTRGTSPEIQEAEETGASLSQGTVGSETRTLELACTSWGLRPGSTLTPRTTRRMRRVMLWSVG